MVHSFSTHHPRSVQCVRICILSDLTFDHHHYSNHHHAIIIIIIVVIITFGIYSKNNIYSRHM